MCGILKCITQHYVLTYGHIVANGGWQRSVGRIVLCYMHHDVVLYVAIVPDLDVVDISCIVYTMSRLAKKVPS